MNEMVEAVKEAAAAAVRIDRESTGAAIVQRVRSIEAKFMQEHPGYSYHSPTLLALAELREFAQFLRLNGNATASSTDPAA